MASRAENHLFAPFDFPLLLTAQRHQHVQDAECLGTALPCAALRNNSVPTNKINAFVQCWC